MRTLAAFMQTSSCRKPPTAQAHSNAGDDGCPGRGLSVGEVTQGWLGAEERYRPPPGVGAPVPRLVALGRLAHRIWTRETWYPRTAGWSEISGQTIRDGSCHLPPLGDGRRRRFAPATALNAAATDWTGSDLSVWRARWHSVPPLNGSLVGGQWVLVEACRFRTRPAGVRSPSPCR